MKNKINMKDKITIAKSIITYFKATLLLVTMLFMSACGGLSTEDSSSPPSQPPRTVVEKIPNLKIADQTIDQGQIFFLYPQRD